MTRADVVVLVAGGEPERGAADEGEAVAGEEAQLGADVGVGDPAAAVVGIVGEGDVGHADAGGERQPAQRGDLDGEHGHLPAAVAAVELEARRLAVDLDDMPAPRSSTTISNAPSARGRARSATTESGGEACCAFLSTPRSAWATARGGT